MSAPAPAGSFEARLRAALAGVRRDDDPETVRDVLAAAGLRLGPEQVQQWLAQLEREGGTR